MTSLIDKHNAPVSRRRILQGLAAAAGIAALPTIVRAASGPIRIGILSPLSGAWTVYGRAHLAGFQLATDEINAAGGILGRQLELVTADTQTDPRVVVEQTNRLVRQERVDFVAGTFTSAGRNAAGPVATAANKVILYPTFYEGQLQKYYPGVCNPNIFMFGPEPTQQIWPHMEYMIKKYGKKFFFIGSDYVWPRVANSFARQKLEELGGSVVKEVYIPFNTPEFASVLRDIQNSGANVVFDTLAGSDCVTFARQFASAGLNKNFPIWALAEEEIVISGLGPEVSLGHHISFDYFMSIKRPSNQSFLKRLRAKFGDKQLMNTVGVGMYNAAHMAALAIAKTGEVSTKALREGLKGLVFDNAPQGSVTMRALDNQAILPSYLMRVREGWTTVDNMFEEVQSFQSVVPKDAQCNKLPL